MAAGARVGDVAGARFRGADLFDACSRQVAAIQRKVVGCYRPHSGRSRTAATGEISLHAEGDAPSPTPRFPPQYGQGPCLAFRRR